MSEPSTTTPGKAGTPEKPVSATRNLIGIIVLFAVVIVGYFEYSAKAGYNAAVAKLNTRSQDEDKDLMSEPEAEELMGEKKTDDLGSEVHDATGTFTKKSYTWHGLISHYTITAYYTKGKAGPALHHYETDQEKFKPEIDAPASAKPAAGAEGTSGKSGPGHSKGDPLANAQPPKPTKVDEKKAEPAKVDEKKAEPAKTDVKKTEPAKTDVKKTDAPAKTDDKKADPKSQ